MPTLTFDIADLVGSDPDPRRTKVWIEANSELLIDKNLHVERFGDATATVDSDGTGAFTNLLATDAAGVNPPTGRLYRVWVDYAKRSGGRDKWNSGWFPLTADTDLSLVGVVDVTAVDVTFREDIFEARDSAATSATSSAASATSAAASASLARSIAEIAVPDDVVAALVADPASASTGAMRNRVTGDALNPASQIGAALTASFAPRVTAPQNAVRRMASGADARILVVTDSTGDATDEWPYLLATHLAGKYTRNTTRWIPANSAGTGYDAAVTIATGSGSGTTSIYSAALAGRHSTAFQGQALNSLIESTNPHVVIVALGHNDGLFTGDPSVLGSPAEAYRLRMLALTESIRYILPHAPLMLMSQNAWQDGSGDMGLKRDELRALAQARGYDLLDIYQAWVEAGAGTSGYYLDNVHPNAAGSQFIAGLVIDAFRPHYNTPPRTEPPSLLGESSRSIIAPLDMPIGATVPLGWTAANVTVTRNTTQYDSTRGYSARLVRTAAGSQSRIFKQVLNAGQVLPYRAKWVTLAVRVRRTAASRFVGRIAIGDDVGTSKSFDDDYSYGDFAWVLVPHKVSATAVGLTVSLYADATTDGSAANADVSFDRLALFPGLWPTGQGDLAPTSDGSWMDYTPTLGNFPATIDYAKFTLLNAKTVRVQFAATLTGAVTGQPAITLPIQAAAALPAGDSAPLGLAAALDTGTGRHVGTVQKMNATTAQFTGSPGAWSDTVPFTWASGDVIAATFEYQID